MSVDGRWADAVGRYRWLEWTRNCLNEHPDGIVELAPDAVRNLALFVGCAYDDLLNHLARFIPEDN